MADEKEWDKKSGIDQSKAEAMQRRMKKLNEASLGDNLEEGWDNLKKAFTSSDKPEPPQGR